MPFAPLENGPWLNKVLNQNDVNYATDMLFVEEW